MLLRPRAFLSIVLLCLIAVPLFAQVDKGAIEAVALDQSKAPLPGVTVTVTRPETGYTTVAVTDATGTARAGSLQPGRYDVAFSLEGFAPVNQKSIVILVGQTAKLTAVMQASASESITVSADVPIVDVHKTDSSTNITPEQIEQLPVPDRDFQRLAFMRHVFLRHLDQVGNQVVAPGELHVDLRERILVSVATGDQAVVDAHGPETGADDQHD